MDIQEYMRGIGEAARAASRELARADTNRKNQALHAIADAIERERKSLLDANAEIGRAHV